MTGSSDRGAYQTFADHPAGALDESEFIGKTALEQHTDAVVAADVGCGDQSLVGSDTEMDEVVYLHQHIQAFGFRRLYFGDLAAEILDEDVVQAIVDLGGLLADELESFVDGAQDFIGNKHPGFQGFLDVRVLNALTQLADDSGGTLRTLTQAAQHQNKYFLRVPYWHRAFLLFIFWFR